MALEFAHGAIHWLAADTVGTTYTISGLPFQPKALRFYWMGIYSTTDAVVGQYTTYLRRGVGFAVSTSERRCVGTIDAAAAGTSRCASFSADDCVVGTVQFDAASRDGELDLNAINSDGFQLIVDDQLDAIAGTDDITVFWEAWGGDDITVATVGDFSEPAATGAQNYAVTGFTSDGANQVVMLAGVRSDAAINSPLNGHTSFYAGCATGTSSSENIVVGGSAIDAAGSMATDGYCQTGECAAQVQGTPNVRSVTARANLSSWGTDQFTLNWSEVYNTGRKSIFLAIKGGSWKVGSYTIDGSTGSATATVSGLTFTPKGVCLMGRMTIQNTSDTVTAPDRIAFGSGTTTSDRRSIGGLDEDNTASSNCEIDLAIEYDQILVFPSTTGTVQSAYDLNAMNSDGFQIIVDVAGGVANEWQGYLTFGSQSLRIPRGVSVGHPFFL